MSLADGATEIEWAPGEKTAWKLVDSTAVLRESSAQERAIAGIEAIGYRNRYRADYIYAGDSEGRLAVSPDGGVIVAAAIQTSRPGDAGRRGGHLGGSERSPRSDRGVRLAARRRA